MLRDYHGSGPLGVARAEIRCAQHIFAHVASGTFETCRMHQAMSEFEGKAENMCSH
jgi:hypothetical protein